jgi:hypothetical protein
VALHASQGRVHSSEWIIRIRSVIEVDGGPIARGVAGIARRRKASRHMARIVCLGPVALVTSETGNRQRCVVVVRVALRAGNRGMGASQREDRVVIECRG